MYKTKDQMKRIVEAVITNHKKEFGTALTKKETKQTVQAALQKKRKQWLESQVSDHSISELQLLLEAIDEHGKS